MLGYSDDTVLRREPHAEKPSADSPIFPLTPIGRVLSVTIADFGRLEGTLTNKIVGLREGDVNDDDNDETVGVWNPETTRFPARRRAFVREKNVLRSNSPVSTR